jgi:hypothetical protein
MKIQTKLLKVFNLQVIEKPKPLDLDKTFENNKEYFELLFIKDFTGYIPKEINEPVLKIFEDQGEMVERWTLWHSWYINRKALSDPLKIPFYNGMMIYLKLLNSIARVNKKVYAPIPKQTQSVDKKPTVDDFINDVEYFRKNANIQTDKNKDKDIQSTETHSSKDGKD